MRDRLYAALLDRLGLREAYELTHRGYLAERGWFASFGTQPPCDGRGRPAPWINYSAIEFLDARLSASLRVFEYGAGQGTLWWASRVAEIVAVEHDSTWAELLRPRLPPNARLLSIPLEAGYVRAIAQAGGVFDVVLVDGRERVACAGVAFDYLSPNGVLLLDDAERDRYRPVFEAARARNYRNIVISGMKPKSFDASSLAMFYRSDNNVLGI